MSSSVRALRLVVDRGVSSELVGEVRYSAESEHDWPGVILREGQVYVRRVSPDDTVRYELEPVYVDGAGYLDRVYELLDLEQAVERAQKTEAAELESAETLGHMVATANAARAVDNEVPEQGLLDLACGVYAQTMGGVPLTEREVEALRRTLRSLRHELARALARQAARAGPPLDVERLKLALVARDAKHRRARTRRLRPQGES